MAKREQAPRLGSAGAKLWSSVMSKFECESHERVLLLERCRVADTLAELHAAIDKGGVIVRQSFEDLRPNPLLVE